MKKSITAAMLLFSTLFCYQNVFAEKVFVPELIEAIWKNDAAKVELLIKQGANVNAKHQDTVLVEAVTTKKVSIEIVKLLIDAKGIDVNKYSTRPMGTYAWYRTPLIAAVEAGNVEAVKLLLARGAKVNLTDNHLPTVDIVGPMPLNSALMYAAWAGSVEMTEMLLNKGANKEQMNSIGLTPLMFSVAYVMDTSPEVTKEKAVKVAALLLDRGAKVDSHGFSSTIRFMKIDLPKGTPASVNPKVISRGGGGVSALMYASRNGFIEGAKLLLDRGAKIELQMYGNKWTPLMLAANSDKTEMVNYLLDRGAKIEAVDTVGNNSLLITSGGLQYDTVTALLRKKANVNAFIPTTGANALMNAINQAREDREKDSLKMMNLLLDNNININFQGIGGNTALMYASGWGVVTKNPDRAELLLDRGARVNLQNRKGETALMMAAYRGHVKTAKLLLERGANMELKDVNGRTALMTASAATIDLKDNNSDFPELVKLLLDKGADINAKDKNKSTALSLATKNGHKKIIALLTAKGGKTDAAEKKDESGKAIIGIWEGLQNSNPYDLHRFIFKTDNTWTYEIKATAAILKQFPTSQHKFYNDSLKDRAKQQGNKGTYSFREQYLVLKTNSFFVPERVFGWSVESKKLHLNGTEFILTKKSK
jgi:ankyrin repeat protein